MNETKSRRGNKYAMLKDEDIHTVTGALKQFFRELKTDLIPIEIVKNLPNDLGNDCDCCGGVVVPLWCLSGFNTKIPFSFRREWGKFRPNQIPNEHYRLLAPWSIEVLVAAFNPVSAILSSTSATEDE